MPHMQRCHTWKFLYISSVLSLFVAYTPRLESSPSFFNRLKLREGKTALLRTCKQSQLFSSSFSVFSKQLVENFSKHHEDANDMFSKQRFLFPREIAPCTIDLNVFTSICYMHVYINYHS